ncbi:hypothetical protein L1887_40733 [Cichorium endivia]|nr:hypothetical protein L1887_40733 [Cichorium endivia]
MERRPPELPPEATPPPVEVFVPSLLNRAKREKSSSFVSSKLNPRSTVKKPGVSIGRRSHSRKTIVNPMDVQFSNATESSDEDMPTADANTLMGSSTPLAIVHPSKCIDGKDFLRLSDLTSHVSVLQKEQAICTTSSSDVSGLDMGVCEFGQSSVAMASEKKKLDDTKEMSVACELPPPLLDANAYPPLPKAVGQTVIPFVQQIVKTKITLPSLLRSPPTSTPPPSVKNKKITNDAARKTPPAGQNSFSFRNRNRRTQVKPYNSKPSLSQKKNSLHSNPVEHHFKSNLPLSKPGVSILKRPLSSDSRNAQNIAPLLRIAAAQQQISSTVDATSSPTSKPVASLALNSIYDLKPDDFRGKNQFEILNAIDDSFSVFCEPNGLASPIVDCENNSSSGLKPAGDNLSAQSQNSSLNFSNSTIVGSSNCSKMDFEGKKTQVQEMPSTTSPVLSP